MTPSNSGEGLRGAVSAFVERARGGDLGSLPVIIGLVVIWTVFQLMNPALLSSRNLVNLTLRSAGLGTIALGVILVLLLGEIDLSLGSVAGVAASVLAVGFVQQSWPLWLAVLAAIASGTAIGARSTSRSSPAW